MCWIPSFSSTCSDDKYLHFARCGTERFIYAPLPLFLVFILEVTSPSLHPDGIVGIHQGSGLCSERKTWRISHFTNIPSRFRDHHCQELASISRLPLTQHWHLFVEVPWPIWFSLLSWLRASVRFLGPWRASRQCRAFPALLSLSHSLL